MTLGTSPEVIYNYVEDVDPNLTCAICQSALVDPVTTSSCKHTFCRDCITRAISHNPSCPIDRSALTLSCLVDTEPLVKLMLDELQVRCDAEGCGIVMQRGLLLAHLRTCTQSFVTCGDEGCGLSMVRHRLPHHRAYECFQRKMECDKCGSVVTFRENKTPTHQEQDAQACDLCNQPATPNKHMHQWACPGVRVPCTHSTRGCPSIVSRSDLSTHLSSCPFEALSSFFEANDARLKAIEQRNGALEEECKALRREVRTLSLAPSAGFYRSLQEANAEALAFPPSPPLIRQSSQSHSREESDATEVPETSMQPSTTVPDSTEPTTEVTEVTGSQPGATSAAPVESEPQEFLSQPRRNFGVWTLNRLASIPSTSEGLDQVVNALRGIVLHLAAGLDSAERRSEVRMTTETLRVLDEVGSLRAIVSSMRRQVMTDLPASPYTSRFSLTHSLTTQTTSSAVSAIMTPTSSAGSSIDSVRSSMISAARRGSEQLADSALDSNPHSRGPPPPLSSSQSEGDALVTAALGAWRPPIRESVVFSDQGVHVSTASRRSSASLATNSGGQPSSVGVGRSAMGVSGHWTGRPCAIPVEQSVTATAPPRRRLSQLGSTLRRTRSNRQNL